MILQSWFPSVLSPWSLRFRQDQGGYNRTWHRWLGAASASNASNSWRRRFQCWKFEGWYREAGMDLRYLLGVPQLVGGLEHFFIFPYIGNNHPTDYIIFFRGVETTNQSKKDSDSYDDQHVSHVSFVTTFKYPLDSLDEPMYILIYYLLDVYMAKIGILLSWDSTIMKWAYAKDRITEDLVGGSTYFFHVSKWDHSSMTGQRGNEKLRSAWVWSKWARLK